MEKHRVVGSHQPPGCQFGGVDIDEDRDPTDRIEGELADHPPEPPRVLCGGGLGEEDRWVPIGREGAAGQGLDSGRLPRAEVDDGLINHMQMRSVDAPYPRRTIAPVGRDHVVVGDGPVDFSTRHRGRGYQLVD